LAILAGGGDRVFGEKITILMYHSINPSPDPYAVTPQAFRRQIEFVSDHYDVVALRDIGKRAPATRRRIVVTFDDAFTDFLEFAYPVLKEHSIPTTMFVPTGLIGTWNSWDQDLPGVGRKFIMTAEQLGALAADPLIDIGSHGVDHVSMRGLSSVETMRQVTESRRVLEDLLGRPITLFSYPFGQRANFSRATVRAVGAAGYTFAVTTCWGSRNHLDDPFRLRRISFADADDLDTVRSKIEGGYDWIGLKERLGFAVRAGLRAITPQTSPRS
jgi:peptidoglycan/xylan/chitin deacetylase (PgdA/CDA1 family)